MKKRAMILALAGLTSPALGQPQSPRPIAFAATAEAPAAAAALAGWALAAHDGGCDPMAAPDSGLCGTVLRQPAGPPRPVTAPPPAPSAAPSRSGVPTRARANLASYVADSDYPALAIAAHEEGTTRFRLNIGTDGAVTTCTVTASSGSTALDDTTCRIMVERARFTPARDARGRAVTDSVVSAIRWVLPAEEPAPAPDAVAPGSVPAPVQTPPKSGSVSAPQGWSGN